MRLEELFREAGLPQIQGQAASLEIKGIVTDSRRAFPGALFVALRGLHTDAHDFVAEAFARGAVFAVTERKAQEVPQICLPDTRAALSALFDAWYGHPASGMRLIGVTGTNGKTSVTTMLYHVLRRAGESVGLIGTVTCLCNDRRLTAATADPLANMTTPDPEQLYALLAQMRELGARYVVMEVTSHALCLSKVSPLHFYRAVFTNLTPDHLDLHGDMESYFLEKRKLFASADAAVISCLGDYGKRLADGLELPMLPLFEHHICDLCSDGGEGVRFRLALDARPELALCLNQPGRFSVENGALAAACALSLGVDAATIERALRDFSGVPGRMERVCRTEAEAKIFLDYAHTPDALEKLLLCVREFRAPGERICLLFGCGGDRDRSKRAVMGRIASRLADFLILTSDNCRSEEPQAILRDILKGVDKEKPYIVIPDRKNAVQYALRSVGRGDILLLVGKGHEEYEIKGEERLAFSERTMVQEYFRARGGES